jgi:AcrR family transcriptional regulator
LTPALVLGEAFAIIDAGGPAALTMRALAIQLGVAPMAVYNHFRDREAILDALAAQVFARLSAEWREATGAHAPKGQALWKPRLRGIVLAAQRFANEHPHIYRLAMTRPTKPESAFELTTEAVAVLRAAGLSQRDAVHAYHAFVLMLQGYPLWREGHERHDQALGCETELDAVAQFEASVDWLIQLIAAAAKRKAPANRRGSSRTTHST